MESVTRAGAAVRFLALFLGGDLLKAFQPYIYRLRDLDFKHMDVGAADHR
jgi:hypothetical protein